MPFGRGDPVACCAPHSWPLMYLYILIYIFPNEDIIKQMARLENLFESRLGNPFVSSFDMLAESPFRNPFEGPLVGQLTRCLVKQQIRFKIYLVTFGLCFPNPDLRTGAG